MVKMTIKKARNKIKELTQQIMETGNESKIDKIERQINILRDFIIFEKDIKGW